MFKVIAHLGEWRNLYTSIHASKSLEDFLPSTASPRGWDGGIFVTTLASHPSSVVGRDRIAYLCLDAPDPISVVALQDRLVPLFKPSAQRLVQAADDDSAREFIREILANGTSADSEIPEPPGGKQNPPGETDSVYSPTPGGGFLYRTRNLVFLLLFVTVPAICLSIRAMGDAQRATHEVFEINAVPGRLTSLGKQIEQMVKSADEESAKLLKIQDAGSVMERSLTDISSHFVKLQAFLKSQEDSQQAAEQSLSQLRKLIADAQPQAKKATDDATAAAAAANGIMTLVNQNDMALQKLSKQIADLTGPLEKLNLQFVELQKDLADSQTRQNALADPLQKLQEQTPRLLQSLQQKQAAVDQIGTDLEKLNKEINQYKQHLVPLNNNTSVAAGILPTQGGDLLLSLAIPQSPSSLYQVDLVVTLQGNAPGNIKFVRFAITGEKGQMLLDHDKELYQGLFFRRTIDLKDPPIDANERNRVRLAPPEMKSICIELSAAPGQGGAKTFDQGYWITAVVRALDLEVPLDGAHRDIPRSN